MYLCSAICYAPKGWRNSWIASIRIKIIFQECKECSIKKLNREKLLSEETCQAFSVGISFDLRAHKIYLNSTELIRHWQQCHILRTWEPREVFWPFVHGSCKARFMIITVGKGMWHVVFDGVQLSFSTSWYGTSYRFQWLILALVWPVPWNHSTFYYQCFYSVK